MTAQLTTTRKKPIKLGYAGIRVSSRGQAMVQHGSLEQQRYMIERWAELESSRSEFEYRIVKFFEMDISGKGAVLHRREDLQELQRAIEKEEIDFYVAEKVDRISRDMIFNLQLVRQAQKHGVDIFEVESGKIDLQDRGSRMSFTMKNWQAEEYTLDLAEKMEKKQRSARLNNGKDTSTHPILGLDKHPSMRGMYTINKKEQKIVREIYEKFIDMNGSYKGVIEFCKSKGYKTKERYTREMTDRDGRIIPPRRLGGLEFNWTRLRLLLTSPKIRGYSYFFDKWNQYQDIADEKGMVRWKYAHGPVLDKLLTEKVDRLMEKHAKRGPQGGKHRDYLMSGILVHADGSPYTGAMANGGKNYYYENKKHRTRFPSSQIERIVINRVKQYLSETGLLQESIESTMKNRKLGLPFLLEKKKNLEAEVDRLEQVVDRFSQTLREAASDKNVSITEVLQSLMAERKKAESELEVCKSELGHISTQITKYNQHMEGITLQRFLSSTMNHFHKLSDLEKKKLIQKVIPLAVITDDNKLELRVNLDPDAIPPNPGRTIRVGEGPNDVAHPLFASVSDQGDSVEYKISKITKNGGRYWTRTSDLYHVKVAL